MAHLAGNLSNYLVDGSNKPTLRFVLWNLIENDNKSSLSKQEREHYNTSKHFPSCIHSTIAIYRSLIP